MQRIVSSLEFDDVVLGIGQRRRIGLSGTQRQPLVLGRATVRTANGLLLLEAIGVDALELDTVATGGLSLDLGEAFGRAIVLDDTQVSGASIICYLIAHLDHVLVGGGHRSGDSRGRVMLILVQDNNQESQEEAKSC